MSVEDNKAAIRRFIDEVINQENMDVLDQFLTPNYHDHSLQPGQPNGIEGFKQEFDMIQGAFSDQDFQIEDILAEDDKVMGRGVYRATHTGEFMGIPATGKKIAVDHMHLARMEGGKMAEHWEVVDAMGMMQQLGVIPTS